MSSGSGESSGDEGQAARPVLRVISGSPTPEELAVLTAVVTAAAAAAPEPSDDARNRRGRWADPAAMHRSPLLFGPNGWRAAGR